MMYLYKNNIGMLYYFKRGYANMALIFLSIDTYI